MTSYNDRVEGVLLGTAAGDALGAPYEFRPPRGPELEVAMVGGGGWEPGEWTDDTSMAIAIAEVAATGADLRDASAQDAIVTRWHDWSRDAKDVGIQTRSVLTAAARDGGITAARARAESAKLHERTGRTAGNGSLMRTAPVALAYLDDEDAMVAAARALSELTHFDPDAGDACVLWCCAIRHAVRTGELDVRIGLHHIDSDRRDLWSKRLDDAESARPVGLSQQRLGGRRAAGRVVGDRHHAACRSTTRPPASSAPIICAWRWMPRCGRATTPTPSRRSRAGCSAPPTAPRRSRGNGAVCCTAGRTWPRTGWWHWRRRSNARANPDAFDFAYPGFADRHLRRHPHDDGVCARRDRRATRAARRCRRGRVAVPSGRRGHAPDDIPHVEVRLIDRPERDENPHLDFVLLDTVRRRRAAPARGTDRAGALRRRVQPHADRGGALRCAAAQHRRRRRAARRHDSLPGAHPNAAFRAALRRLRRRARRTWTSGQDSADPNRLRQPKRCLTTRDSLIHHARSGTACSIPSLLFDDVVAAGHRLADAAKVGDWCTVFSLLDDPSQPVDINWWRPGGTAWFTRPAPGGLARRTHRRRRRTHPAGRPAVADGFPRTHRLRHPPRQGQ